MQDKAAVSENKNNICLTKEEIKCQTKKLFMTGHPKNSFDRCFKKQKENPQFSYQSRNILPVQQVNYVQGDSRNYFSRGFNEQNQQFSYQRRNVLPVQQVNYEQRHSRNFFGRCFKYQNQQLSHQRSGELPVQQINSGKA